MERPTHLFARAAVLVELDAVHTLAVVLAGPRHAAGALGGAALAVCGTIESGREGGALRSAR